MATSWRQKSLAWLVMAMMLYQPAKVEAGPVLTVAGRVLLATELTALRDGTKLLRSGYNGEQQFNARYQRMYNVFCVNKENYGLDREEGDKGEGQNSVKGYAALIKKELKDTTSVLFSVFSRNENRVDGRVTPSPDQKIEESKTVACQWCGNKKKTVWNELEFICEEPK